MKIINLLILILTILVLGSGSILGYLIYMEQFGDAPLSSIALDEGSNCIDVDRDGYGRECAKGPDCDDSDDSLHDQCGFDAELELSVASNKVDAGNQVIVDVIVSKLPNTPSVSAAELYIDYDPAVLTLVANEFDEEYLMIPIDDTDVASKGEAARFDFAKQGELKEGDRIISLTFSTATAGTGFVSVLPATIFSTSTGSELPLPSENSAEIEITVL
jgi:hypothetical protein